jgi:hypothetical protein
MSLRKSPRLTPALFAAARKNAQHSTGPRTPAGKQNSRLNALKHGRYARLENHRYADPRLCKIARDPGHGASVVTLKSERTTRECH